MSEPIDFEKELEHINIDIEGFLVMNELKSWARSIAARVEEETIQRCTIYEAWTLHDIKRLYATP